MVLIEDHTLTEFPVFLSKDGSIWKVIELNKSILSTALVNQSSIFEK